MACKIKNNSDYNISEIEDLVQDLYSFSSNKMGFKKPPVLNLVSDKENTSPLGKTAYYDPASMEITIYVDGRHPKDIMRSFSHELVHHNQNLNGEFDNVMEEAGEGYAQKNPHLRKMEKQAYLEGNMIFRDWEDGYKSSNPNILNERRIYKMSIKDWKDKELNTLLNEKWGFSMDLSKLNESKEITHMCALEVTHKKSGKKGHPIKHTLTESGQISHYTVEFENVIVENISVDNLDILVQEEHSHKRDDEKKHDKKKKVVSEEELENKEKADLDKDGKLSGYEKKRGKAIEKSMKGQKDKKTKGDDSKEDKPKKKAKKGEIPPQLKPYVKGDKKDDDEKEDIEEIQMRAGGLGKTPKKETDAAKKQSDKNYAHLRKKMDKKDSLKEGESEIEEIKSMLMQNLTNDESGDAEVKKQIEALAKMIKQKRDKNKPPPKAGGNNSGAPAQPSMEEQKLREAIRRIIKKKLKK